MKPLSNKKVLALVSAALGPCAVADVTLYGHVAAALEADSFNGANALVVPSTTSVQDYGSYFGIRGSDSVYGETAAIWQIEQFVNIASNQAYSGGTGYSGVPIYPGTYGPYNNGNRVTSSTNTLASSDSYLGLQGAWGKVRIGNLSNAFRTNTGAVDVYNGANANVLGTYDRALFVMPTSIRYDSPAYGNFSFLLMYSSNNQGDNNTGGYGAYSALSGNQGANGNYGSPIYNIGLAYQPGNFSMTLNTQLWQDQGNYQYNGGTLIGQIGNQNVSPYNAYISRLELGYSDPDSIFVGAGLQISQGFGWSSVPIFGAAQNYWYNPKQVAMDSHFSGAPGAQYLNANILSTQELGATIGWHVGQFTPKISYVRGNNLMTNANTWQLITGSGEQISDSGYQQAVAELDWNITPRTIAFINYGMIWWGNTMQNMQLQASTTATPGNPQSGCGVGNSYQPNCWVNSNPGSLNNQTAAIGFTHNF
jgi:predicted porin